MNPHPFLLLNLKNDMGEVTYIDRRRQRGAGTKQDEFLTSKPRENKGGRRRRKERKRKKEKGRL